MGQGHKCALHLVSVDFDESSQRPVISPFHVIGEEASRELSHSPVILEAIAANTLAMARFIRAVAILEITVFLTFFHDLLHRRIILPMLRYSGSVFSRGPSSDTNNLPGRVAVFPTPVGRSEHLLPAALPVV